MNREYFVLIILLFICIILFFIKLILNNNIDQYDDTIPELEQKTHTLSLENQSLRNQYLQEASYSEIQRKAKLSGFIPAPFVTP